MQDADGLIHFFKVSLRSACPDVPEHAATARPIARRGEKMWYNKMWFGKKTCAT